ncbi:MULTISPECIES: hypothetical protein [unclassified Lysobacter]|jgi:hypothetical protein|uniref:hypothetical protein n=1 Tax=unclassified Lysobacter TaxID=2635362 RepID=UPI001F5810F4|nr:MULTISPECIES: hypothetical protein [unclassified Lysobacter]
MVEMLFPRIADNRYPGRRLGLWLFGLMPLKIAMGLNVMVNAPEVAQTADGVPVSSFGAAAAAAFSFVFAAWGLGQLVLGLASLVVLLRYRSLVPLAFLLLLIEQSGRMSLRLLWPVQRIDAPGSTINLVLVALLALGFILSIWRPRQASGGV